MKVKPFKFIFWVFTLLLVVIVAAVVILPQIIDPNDFKPQIATAVKERTGRTLEIDGDISLSVFPWLGLDIGSSRLSNAAGFAEPHMARVEQVQVRVKLVPLLSKELEVDTIRLSGLQLNLGKDSAGRSNWADLQSAAAQGSEQAPAEKKPGKTPAIKSLSVGGIKIDDARLVWDDRAGDSRYEIQNLTMATGAFQPGKPFNLDLQFELAAAGQAAKSVVSLKGDVLVAPDLNAIDITGAKLLLDAQGEGVPAGKMNLSLVTDIAVDLDAQTLSMPAVVLKALGMNITGNIAGTNISSDTPKFSGKFNVAEFSPRALIKALGAEVPVTTDASVLAKANAALQWKASTTHFTADSLQLQLDDTRVNGSAKVARFDAPEISFTLAADSFDLDRYLPPASGGKKTDAKKSGAALGKQGGDELPVEALRGLNLNGKLNVASLKAFNLRSTDVELQIKAANGLLRVTPARAHLYEGKMQNEITLDVRNKTPRLTFDYDLDKVMAGQLLRDLTGSEKLLGITSFRSNITANGMTADAIKRSLNGTASFTLTEGTVKGVNIAALLRTARARLKGEPVPASAGSNQTDFTELSGTVVITDGVIRNNDLVLNSPLLRLAGKGKASLSDETIDYTVIARLVGSLDAQNASLSDLKGVSIPVRIGGTFSKPSYAPDIAAALRDAATARVEEKVVEKVEEKKQEIREKLGDKLGEELQDKLKGLFR